MASTGHRRSEDLSTNLKPGNNNYQTTDAKPYPFLAYITQAKCILFSIPNRPENSAVKRTKY